MHSETETTGLAAGHGVGRREEKEVQWACGPGMERQGRPAGSCRGPHGGAPAGCVLEIPSPRSWAISKGRSDR